MIVGGAITIRGELQKRSHESMYKTDTRIKGRVYEGQLLLNCKDGRAITKRGALEKMLKLTVYQFFLAFLGHH